jgi:thiol-disulfide isomerase/thioredoxin
MKKLFYFLFVSHTLVAQPFFFNTKDSTDLYFDLNITPSTVLNLELEKPNNQQVLTDFTQKFVNNFDQNLQYKSLLTINADEWEMQLFDKRAEELAFINQNKNNISVEVFEYLKNEINFKYWHYIFAYPVLRSNLDQKMKRVVSLPKIMTKGFTLPQNADLIHNKNFRQLLPYYITYQNSEEKEFVKYSDMIKSTVDKAEYALKSLNGLTLDYYLSTLLVQNKQFLNLSTAKYVISQIETENIQNYFKNSFLDEIAVNEALALEKAKENERKSKEKASATLQLEDMDGNLFDLSKFKGKVVYVDFWASWCGPCRREFPFSKRMHESLSEKEKKNIVFLYISIDDNKDLWKNAVKNLELDKYTNGFSKGGWGSEVVQKFKITGIPRYMIINKNGEIVSKDAKRPSNPETITELLELAK